MDQKYLKWIISFLIILLVELFVFNFRHWESLGNKEIVNYQITEAEGLIRQADGTYILAEGEKYLEISGIDSRLNTLFIDVEILSGGDERATLPVTLYLSARDESHENYYGIPSRQIWHSQERSQYLNWHLYGDCKSIRITPALGEGTQVKILLKLNPVIPLFFSFGRVVVVCVLILLFRLFRPSSLVYRISFVKLGKAGSVLMILFFAIHLLVAGMLIHINPFFVGEPMQHHTQYQRLAESLSQGKVYLMDEPAEALVKMENPYDYDLRNQVMAEHGQGFLWDHAYFQGKYYVYFGVVPAVLFYLPYYLITGEGLHNYQVIFIGAAMLLSGIIGIISRIIKRWFPETSLGTWFLLSELTIVGSGFINICKRPDMYTVPIVVGLGMGLLGLWSFLCAEKADGSLSYGKLILGSLCTALVAGCRPQLFLIVLLAIVILRKYIFSFTYLQSGQGIKSAASVAIPMITVAVLLMYYNYARFGSPFDFGANYNLTFNDMRNRGFVLDRIPLGIWAYMFAPLKYTLTFPFAEANYFSTNYLGTTISEATFGGILAVNLFVWMGPLALILRNRIKRDTPYALIVSSLLIGIAVIIVDTEMSGILMRYFSDFNIFFLLAAGISWLLCYQTLRTPPLRSAMRVFLVTCLLLLLVYQVRIFFLDAGEALMDMRKDLFSSVKYQIMFWL